MEVKNWCPQTRCKTCHTLTVLKIAISLLTLLFFQPFDLLDQLILEHFSVIAAILAITGYSNELIPDHTAQWQGSLVYIYLTTSPPVIMGTWVHEVIRGPGWQIPQNLVTPVWSANLHSACKNGRDGGGRIGFEALWCESSSHTTFTLHCLFWAITWAQSNYKRGQGAKRGHGKPSENQLPCSRSHLHV